MYYTCVAEWVGYEIQQVIKSCVMRVRIPIEAFFLQRIFSQELLRGLCNLTLFLTISSSVLLLLFLLPFFFLNSVLSYFFFNSSVFITFVPFSHTIFIYLYFIILFCCYDYYFIIIINVMVLKQR